MTGEEETVAGQRRVGRQGEKMERNDHERGEGVVANPQGGWRLQPQKREKIRVSLIFLGFLVFVFFWF